MSSRIYRRIPPSYELRSSMLGLEKLQRVCYSRYLNIFWLFQNFSIAFKERLLKSVTPDQFNFCFLGVNTCIIIIVYRANF